MLREFGSLVFIGEGGFLSPTAGKKQGVPETPTAIAWEARFLGHSPCRPVLGATMSPHPLGPSGLGSSIKRSLSFQSLWRTAHPAVGPSGPGGAGRCPFSGKGSAVGSGLGLSPWVSHPPCGSGHDYPPWFPHLDNGGKLCPPTPESEETLDQETQGKALCALKIHVCNYKWTVFPRKCRFGPQNQRSAKQALLRRAAPSIRPADHSRGGPRHRTALWDAIHAVTSEQKASLQRGANRGGRAWALGLHGRQEDCQRGTRRAVRGGPGAARSRPGRTSSPDSPGDPGRSARPGTVGSVSWTLHQRAAWGAATWLGAWGAAWGHPLATFTVWTQCCEQVERRRREIHCPQQGTPSPSRSAGVDLC